MAQPSQVDSPSVETVKTMLRQLIVEVSGLDPATIVDSSTLEEDIQLSSIAFVEVQAALEDTFAIQIDPVEVVEQNTFADIAELIVRKIQQQVC